MIGVPAQRPQSLKRVRRGIRFALAGAALLAASFTSAPAAATPIRLVGSYPTSNAQRVAPTAELYFAFDQPTAKSGAFSVADLDSFGGTLLTLLTPRWSALGDTVFLKPSQPMQFGHRHGMLVNVIEAPDPQNSAVDLPSPTTPILFNVTPRANVQRIGTSGLFESISLVPDDPTPLTLGVREIAGTAATFTRARYRFYPSDEVDLNAPLPIAPGAYTDVPFTGSVPRLGTAYLTVPITLTRSQTAAATSGILGLEVVFEGYDETGYPYSFSASSRVRLNSFPGDNTLVLTRAQVTPALGASIAIGSVFLEAPLPGTTIAAGDTIRPRAVVTGIGTGSFRGAFYMDGEFAALVEGFLEAGRPDTVTTPGPLPTRRLGEHRLQFVVESPQNVASSPVTILCVAGSAPGSAGEGSGESRTTIRLPEHAPAGANAGVAIDLGTLAQANSRYGDASGSATYWSRSTGYARFGAGARLEANAVWRVRLDDTKNGSASPERANVRLAMTRGTVEWGDLAPALSAGSPLLASPVPRRAAQATWNGGAIGTLETYVAMESHPRSAGGVAREVRSDLYAARLSRAVGARMRLTAYGGYTHEDPTPGGVETATRARAVYGGSGTVILPGGWRWLGDLATVRHRAIEGVETGRSRTGVRTELAGKVVGADLRAEGFRYQPDLATELNPYAISDRQGVALSVNRSVRKLWRIFGDYRFEEPQNRPGPVPTPFGLLGGTPYVSVERLAFGTAIPLGPSSSVTPLFTRIRHRGAQTDLSESRLSGEFTTAEPLGGRTTARFDVARFDDDLGVAKKRKLVAGSFLSTRRHPGHITTTLGIGVENDSHSDLDLRDRTVQGTFELRWEARVDRLAVIPYVVYNNRDLETVGLREEIVSGRLQLLAMRIEPLRGASLAIEGRVNHSTRSEPIGGNRTDYGASLTLSGGGAAPR